MRNLWTSGASRAGGAISLFASLATLCAGGPVFAQQCSDGVPPVLDCCGPQNQNDCCAAGAPGAGGCNDQDCCFTVCFDVDNPNADSFCCEVQWDASCAAQALDLCLCPPEACSPSAGPCDQEHGTPGCADEGCCALVCDCDPFCCSVQWDAFCVGPNGDVAGCSWFDLCQSCDLAEGACTAPPCPADTNGDGEVDVQDLTNLVLSWGTNGQGPNFDSDLNDDGTVNVQDLTLLITNWGPCDGTAAGGGSPEGEACGSESNGGCNMSPPVLQSVACPATICGTAWASDGMRDTDWYSLTVAGPCTRITAELVSEFPGRVAVVDFSNCTVPLVLGQESLVAPCGGEPAVALVAAGTYAVFVANTAFGEFPCGSHNDYVLTITCEALPASECECSLACPPGAAAEGEACGASTNGGCNVTPPAFSPITCDGAVVCGAAWATAGMRDTDWYQFTLAADSNVAATLNSEFPGIVRIVGGIATCNPVTLALGSSNQCSPLDPDDVPAQATLGAGTFAAFVATGNPDGSPIFDGFPCGSLNDYVLTLTCGACQLKCSGTSEGEACGSNSNGGCNSTPPVFGSIASGQTMCGTAWAAGGSRDTDWYLITVPLTTITATLTSEFNGQCFIIGGVGNCNPLVLGTGSANECAPSTPASANVAAGTYALFVATVGFDGVPCGGVLNDYRLTVSAP